MPGMRPKKRKRQNWRFHSKNNDDETQQRHCQAFSIPVRRCVATDIRVNTYLFTSYGNYFFECICMLIVNTKLKIVLNYIQNYSGIFLVRLVYLRINCTCASILTVISRLPTFSLRAVIENFITEKPNRQKIPIIKYYTYATIFIFN